MPLSVEKIEDGSVIDHITAGHGLHVLAILKIDEKYAGRVALVMNVPSKTMGKKDIVKIEGKIIDEKTADKIAVIAPHATLNIIKKGEVTSKNQVEMPSKLVGVFKCPNPKCVTTTEKIETDFEVEKRSENPNMRCAYCERTFTPEELRE
ncbi:aspartate carbamoyltransferase regulatory subunit [Candidatus Micrarchaeota archaeon]|nr:aspartate carbamoyltransferase regulatory subunit [Candidatus Micrarchaeota archaeon]